MYSGRIIVVAFRQDFDIDLYKFKNWRNANHFMKKNRQSKRDDKAVKFEILFDDGSIDELLDFHFTNLVGK